MALQAAATPCICRSAELQSFVDTVVSGKMSEEKGVPGDGKVCVMSFRFKSRCTTLPQAVLCIG
jgi:hypothetical protein